MICKGGSSPKMPLGVASRGEAGALGQGRALGERDYKAWDSHLSKVQLRVGALGPCLC